MNRVKTVLVLAGILFFSSRIGVRAQHLGGVDPVAGAVTSSVQFDIPKYHGIEPGLGLKYNSNGISGLAPVGWQLEGLSAIQRVSPTGYGAPTYDSNVNMSLSSDKFLLDGMELVQCSNSIGPCSGGGEFKAKWQSPQRIVFNESDGTWTVTQPNGVKTTYSRAIYDYSWVSPNCIPYNWVLTRVEDLAGNHVDYTYRDVSAGSCSFSGENKYPYPDTISYGPYTVRFLYSSRTDTPEIGTGRAFITMSKILSSVVVYSGTQIVRAYDLTTPNNAESNRDDLTVVDLYGTDAAVVAGGYGGEDYLDTSKPHIPIRTFSYYSGNTSNYSRTVDVVNDSSACCGGSSGEDDDDKLTADFNGDGYDDIATAIGHTNQWKVFLAENDGSGFNGPYNWGKTSGGTNVRWCGDTTINCTEDSHSITGDFNGDGKMDIAVANHGGASNSMWYMFLSDSAENNFTTAQWSAGADICVGTCAYNRLIIITGDFNGDGLTDIARTRDTIHNWRLWIAKASGGFDTYTDSSVDPCATSSGNYGCDAAAARFLPGDFNGDGRTDIARTGRDNIDVVVWLGNGTSFSESTWLTAWGCSGTCGPEERYLAADFNGDGKTDLFRTGITGTGYQFAYSNGADFVAATAQTTTVCSDCANNNTGLWAMDISGDGRADILNAKANDTYWRANIYDDTATGDLRAESWNTTITCRGSCSLGARVQTGDYNGDRRMDIVTVEIKDSDEWDFHIFRSSSEAPDLVKTIGDDKGLTTTVQYTNFNGRQVFGRLSSLARSLNLKVASRVKTELQNFWNYDTSNDPCGGSSCSWDPHEGRVVTSYTYWNPVWSLAEKILLGFEWVTSQQTGSSLQTTTYYLDKDGSGTIQPHDACRGVVWRSVVKDLSKPTSPVDEQTIGESTQGYSYNASSPYYCYASDQYKYTYQYQPSPVTWTTRQSVLTFDDWGQPLASVDYGDTGVSTDDKVAVTTYAYNTSAYIIGAVRKQTVCSGSNPAVCPVKLAEARYCYDGESETGSGTDPVCSTAPVKGLVTGKRQWDDNGPGTDRWVAVDMQYYTATPNLGNRKATSQPYFTGGPYYFNGGTDTIYDSSGLFVAQEIGYEYDQSSHLKMTTTAAWDHVLGQKLCSVDTNGVTTYYKYDTYGRTVKISAPLKPAPVTCADGTTTAAQLDSDVWPNYWAVTKTYVININNNYTVTQSRASVTVDDPAASEIFEAIEIRDSLNRVIQTKSRTGTSSHVVTGTTAHDGLGRPQYRYNPFEEAYSSTAWTAFTAPSGSLAKTESIYDSQNRVIQTNLPGGTTSSASYELGKTTGIDPNGKQRISYTDIYGRNYRIDEFAASGTPISTLYDFDILTGRLLRIARDTNSSGTIDSGDRIDSQMTYNSLGQQLSLNDINSGLTTYEYNALGAVTKKTDARGNQSLYSYDILGRLTLKCAVAGSGVTDPLGLTKTYGTAPVAAVHNAWDQCTAGQVQIASYTYDKGVNGIGVLDTLADLSGTTAYSYDIQGRITGITQRMDYDSGTNTYRTFELTRSFDLTGRLLSVAYPDKENVCYTYSNRSQIVSIVGYDDSSSGEASSCGASVTTRTYLKNATYDTASGSMLTVELGKTVESPSGVALTTTTRTYYTDTYRLNTLGTVGPGSTTLQNLSYAYDNIGNITGITDSLSPSKSQTFTYDGLSRLLTASGGYGSLVYTYDGVGNFNTFEGNTLWYNAPNGRPDQLTMSTSGWAANYDNNGNAVSRSWIKQPGTFVEQWIAWGYDNRIATVMASVNYGDPTDFASFVYDGHGTRAIKYAGGQPTYYFGNWFELRPNLAVKHIMGPGGVIASVSYDPATRTTLNNFIKSAAASISDQLKDKAERLYADASNVNGGPVHAKAVIELISIGFALALWLCLIWAASPLRRFRDLVKDLETAEEQLAREAMDEALGRALERRSRRSYRWGYRQTVATMLVLIIGFVTSGCGRDPVGNGTGPAAGLRVTGSATGVGIGSGDSLIFLHGDHLGSVNVVTDSTGTEISRSDYKPFGAIWNSPNSSVNDRSFTSKRLDSDLGLMNFENRYYDPLVGRFISSDPRQLEPAPLQAMRIAEWGYQSGSASPGASTKDAVKEWQGRTFQPQDLNRYSYVLNNPVNKVDSDGYGWWKKLWKNILQPVLFLAASYLMMGMGSLSMQCNWFPVIGAAMRGAGRSALFSTIYSLIAGRNVTNGFVSGMTSGAISSGIISGYGFLFPHDSYAGVSGALGNVAGIFNGVAETSGGVLRLNPNQIFNGIGTLLNSLVPRYGTATGPGWGDVNTLPVDDGMDQAAYEHDRAYFDAENESGLSRSEINQAKLAADRTLVLNTWSANGLGPYGSVYRIGLVAAFQLQIAIRQNIGPTPF